MPEPQREWHVTSLVVRHRPEAIPAHAAAIVLAQGLELALQDDTRSVLLQESDGTGGLMASVDMLRALPGVLTVDLVYHHVGSPDDGDPSAIDPEEQTR